MAISRDCNFGADRDNQIRDQILFHCKSEYLQRQLLEEGDTLTLKKTLEIAANCERVEERLKILRVTPAVNKVSKTEPKKASKPEKKPGKKKPVCYRCGDKSHYGRDPACPARGKTCSKCHLKDHYAAMCRTKIDKNANCVEPETEAESDYAFATTSKTFKNKLTTIKVGGIELEVLADSGASVNIVDSATWEMLKSKRITCKSFKTSDEIKPYGSPPIPVIGKFNCDIESGPCKINDTFSVIEGKGEVPLISRTASISLGLLSLNTVNSVKIAKDDWLKKFPKVFSGLGKLKTHQIKLHVKETANPVAQPLRRTPFSLREKVENKIKELIKCDIIEPVDHSTGWVNPVVCVPKPNGDIRLCLDMRRANEAIERVRYPIPTVDEVLQSLNGSTVFSKLDLKYGYHQIELEPESRDITTFVVHTGLYRYKRLLFGVNSATEQYQHEVQRVIAGIEGSHNISDDIIVHAATQEEHDERLNSVLKRLEENGLTLNPDKCQFNMPKLTFMGLLLSERGIGPTESKVKAIVEASEPSNASEMRSFLGLAAFNARFIPDFATITEPLRKLTHKGVEFKMGQSEKCAFEKLKTAMSKTSTLAYFDLKAKTKIITDASPVGLGAVLIQEQKGRPVIISYASRSLSPVERRYSQTEREALAIVWACEHFHAYIYGVKFQLLTDHKPLEAIYGVKSKPCARVQRWVLRLQEYDFEIKYIPGKENIADSLSRLLPPNGNNQNRETETENYVRFVAIQATPQALTTREIERESAKDRELENVRNCLINNDFKELPKAYIPIVTELCVYGQLILRGTRIVMPEKLRSQTISLAHEGHLGIVNTKLNLRSKVWWPGIDRAAEKFVRSCTACQMVSKPDPPEPIKNTELPPGPWQDVATDLLGPLPSGDSLLVVVDYFSRYIEVAPVRQTTTFVIIQKLQEIFSRHGIPVTLKSDNGPQFKSDEFRAFCESNNVQHIKVTSRYAQANGEVERQNSSIVKRLQTAQVERKPWKSELQKYLLAYRSLPHATTGVSPAELLFNRKLRTKVPTISERPESEVRDARDRDAENKGKYKMYADERRHARPSEIMPGDVVLVKQDRKDKLTSTFGETPHEVVEKKGNSLIVKAPSGTEYSRNNTHLKKLETQETNEQCVKETPAATQASSPNIEESRPKRQISMPKKYLDYEVNIKR